MYLLTYLLCTSMSYKAYAINLRNASVSHNSFLAQCKGKQPKSPQHYRMAQGFVQTFFYSDSFAFIQYNDIVSLTESDVLHNVIVVTLVTTKVVLHWSSILFTLLFWYAMKLSTGYEFRHENQWFHCHNKQYHKINTYK